MTETSVLNLARKWRPSNFSEVIGQDLSIRMLKNSLYLKKYFPLYIFAGQRGCGKTSTARIFAAAMNCEILKDFQADPKNNDIPCGKCESCKSIRIGNHPDFIEMDAASHTGVENVRQILESASFISLSGGVKLYLIDEAHMLSKAAFNAFLKILEEPPPSVFFILATTEISKIPETVRSRAFQVFFNSIEPASLKDHISMICEKEKVIIEPEAVELIISESGGSARDAINLLEQVRFLDKKISSELVLKSLGKMAESKLYELFELIVDQNSFKLLEFLNEVEFFKLNPQSLWSMIVSLGRIIIWVKHGVKNIPYPYSRNLKKLSHLASKCSINRLNAIMQLFLTQEGLFIRTQDKHLLLETVLLQVCGQVNVVDLEQILSSLDSGSKECPPTRRLSPKKELAPIRELPPVQDKWKLLVGKVAEIGDPLLSSIFKPSEVIGATNDKVLRVVLINNSPFIMEKITDSMDILRPLVKEFYPNFEEFKFEMSANKVKVNIFKSVCIKKVDLSDKTKWPKASLLGAAFSGRLEIVGNDDSGDFKNG